VIQTIHLDRVLREAVPTPYGDLVTRPTGAAVRGHIQRTMATAARGALTRLDFSAVRLIDFSCADEVVAKLLLAFDPAADHYVVLHGLSDDQAEAIDHVLIGHRLAIAALTVEVGQPVVLGWATGDDRAAFDAVQRIGGGDTATLTRHLAWHAQRCRDVLGSLAHRRLVRQAAHGFLPLVMP
jgi:hypothetical protein